MKKLVSIVSVLIIVCAGCNDVVKETVRYQINEPVFMSVNEFRSMLSFTETPQKIEKQGKICFYNGYLYIAEQEKGIHIIDNRDPSNPVSKGFIELAGNHDIAVKNDILYADALIDLVWFDLSNPARPEYKGRLEDVFTSALPICDNEYGYDYYATLPEVRGKDKIVIGWEVKERVETYERKQSGGDLYYDSGVTNSGNSSGGSSSGVNGSFSLFGLYDKYLYTIVESELTAFDLSGNTPLEVAKVPYVGRGWQVETVFNYKDNLFMGTPQGMLIYSVENPLQPEYLSSYMHIYGCDPVVVEDDVAYVTVRSGNSCGQNIDVLFIVDVSNPRSPKEIVSYSMTNPKGLGIDNKILFVCDDGLKIFKADDPQTIMANKLKHVKEINGFDVIPHNNILMMIADNGIYQYDYSDINNIKELSRLLFK